MVHTAITTLLHNRRSGLFARFSHWVAVTSGHPAAFVFAVTVVIVWVLTGPLFGYSEAWQLVINTGTTIITFLMVFLIQNTQNRDIAALQIKLDELIRSNASAHNSLLDLEELTEEELTAIKQRYEGLAHQAREQLTAGKRDQGRPVLKIWETCEEA
jgi:low affinity Fe/Cu permease